MSVLMISKNTFHRYMSPEYDSFIESLPTEWPPRKTLDPMSPPAPTERTTIRPAPKSKRTANVDTPSTSSRGRTRSLSPSPGPRAAMRPTSKEPTDLAQVALAASINRMRRRVLDILKKEGPTRAKEVLSSARDPPADLVEIVEAASRAASRALRHTKQEN